MIWLRSPDFADVFVRGQAAECLETACLIVGIKKVAEMVAKLIVTIVVTPLHGCVLNRAVRPCDLPVGPWMVWLG